MACCLRSVRSNVSWQNNGIMKARGRERRFEWQASRARRHRTISGLSVYNGGFHIKAATMEFDRPYFAAKINANFPLNRVREGLPTIQGTITLCDAVNGYPLALMDSTEITMLRTGAASAVAAKYLARRDSKTLTILGCGTQGRVHLRALARVCEPEFVY